MNSADKDPIPAPAWQWLSECLPLIRMKQNVLLSPLRSPLGSLPKLINTSPVTMGQSSAWDSGIQRNSNKKRFRQHFNPRVGDL